MGTSTHNIGQNGKTPLVPSWLDAPNEGNPVVIGTKDRFTQPRRDFTRYINSPEHDTGIAKRSISNYVRNTMGGSKNATRRLGTARNSNVKLLNIVGVFADGGAHAVERYLSLENLAQKNATDVLIAIADFICPDGGPQDEGIARSAYISAIEESPEIADVAFEELTTGQMLLIIQKSMAHVVCNRIMNDIGNKIILLPRDVDTADTLVSQIEEFITGTISDAMTRLNINTANLTQKKSEEIIDNVYQIAFEIMENTGVDE